MINHHLFISLLTLLLIALAGCDTGITGEAFENQPPNTSLSVRDTSLVDNLAGLDRLSSTVLVSWTGTDPDGFVSAFEIRFFSENDMPSPEEGWVQSTRNDSLVLLPIPRGERFANVTFEVRSIDNEGLKDPSPAKTVFPIQNAPPTIRFNTFDLPPDTTFHVFSFAWTASDPEGISSLSRIEISLNDSTSFTAIDPEVDFLTLVADVDRSNPAQSIAEAEVFTGRGFQTTNIRVPGLLLDDENTLYLRAVDQTDTTSTLQRVTWYVKKTKSDILFVNDYRKSTAPTIQQFHIDLLASYLPPGQGIDIWDLSQPFATGSSGNVPRSSGLPTAADPTLRKFLSTYSYIYWVSTSTTNRVQGNNLPFVAGIMDDFFESGGKMMVHTPVSAPATPEDNLGNPAILLLPLNDITALPDSVSRLELRVNATVLPGENLPGINQTLPTLISKRFFINELPFGAQGANTIPLYNAAYQYRSTSGNQSAWPGPNTIASISADQRIGLFALPLVNEQTGALLFEGEDGDLNAPQEAVHLMLESIGFPKR